MLQIQGVKSYLQKIYHLNGKVVRFVIVDKKLQLEIDTDSADTVIDVCEEFECDDLIVEYDFDDFKSLLCMAKKFNCSCVCLSKDNILYCKNSYTTVHSLFISPLHKRYKTRPAKTETEMRKKCKEVLDKPGLSELQAAATRPHPQERKS